MCLHIQRSSEGRGGSRADGGGREGKRKADENQRDEAESQSAGAKGSARHIAGIAVNMSVAGEGCVTDEAPDRERKDMARVGPRAGGPLSRQLRTGGEDNSRAGEGMRPAAIPSGAT